MLHSKESDRIGQAVNVAEFAKLRRWRGAGRELEVHRGNCAECATSGVEVGT